MLHLPLPSMLNCPVLHSLFKRYHARLRSILSNFWHSILLIDPFLLTYARILSFSFGGSLGFGSIGISMAVFRVYVVHRTTPKMSIYHGRPPFPIMLYKSFTSMKTSITYFESLCLWVPKMAYINWSAPFHSSLVVGTWVWSLVKYTKTR